MTRLHVNSRLQSATQQQPHVSKKTSRSGLSSQTEATKRAQRRSRSGNAKSTQSIPQIVGGMLLCAAAKPRRTEPPLGEDSREANGSAVDALSALLESVERPLGGRNLAGNPRRDSLGVQELDDLRR